MTKIKLCFMICLFINMIYAFNTEGKNKNLSQIKNIIKPSDSSRYAENVHMYICIEALKLLKDRFPEMNWTEFDNHIGTMDDIGTRHWQLGKITTGAARSDMEDVVFDIRGPFNFFASTSHFWNADNRSVGDHSLTDLNILTINYTFPNSYTRVTKLINGNWQKWDENHYTHRNYIVYNPGNGMFYRFSYHLRGLIDLYKTNRIWLESINNVLGQTQYIRRETTINNYLRNIFVWEALGEIAHAIQDISVPSHNHNDVHVFGDCYHDYIDGGGFRNYTWETAKANGGFWNPYSEGNDPLRYLMYSVSQIADHFPSGPDCMALPPEHFGNNNLPGGSYNIISSYYDELGPPPPVISNVYNEGNYCFNLAIRATAALFYWFGIEAGLLSPDPLALPVINGFTKNIPDYDLYIGETLKLIASTGGSNLNYNWFIKVCDTNNRCMIPIPGIVSSQHSNEFLISNVNFKNRWSCSRYDSLCNVSGGNNPYEEPLYFKVGLTISNQFGHTTKYFDPRFFFNPKESIRPPSPPFSGCPFLMIKHDYRLIYENNILKKSMYSGNNSKDVEDKYILNNEPDIDLEERTITLAVRETNNDLDYFDKISLFAVDHPEDTKAGVDENNCIVIYRENEIQSPDYASINGIDVTDYLAFDTAYSKSVKGNNKDFLQLKFGEYNFRNENAEDSIALIFDPHHYSLSNDPHIIKRQAGEIRAIDYDGYVKNFSPEFGIRQLNSTVIIPLFKNKNISIAEINWKRSFELSYAAMVKVNYSGFTIHTLQMIEATDNSRGDVLGLIAEKDSVYAETDSISFIIMKFKIPDFGPYSGIKRDYIFITEGRYNNAQDNLSPALKRKELNSANSPSKDRLISIYPNPFNPVTKINFEISPGSSFEKQVTLKVYDILGKEIATLVNQKQIPGLYSVNFNGSNLSSGIYYAVLKSYNGTIETRDIRKIILIR